MFLFLFARTKIFIRFPRTLFATEDAFEFSKHQLGIIFCLSHFQEKQVSLTRERGKKSLKCGCLMCLKTPPNTHTLRTRDKAWGYKIMMGCVSALMGSDGRCDTLYVQGVSSCDCALMHSEV